jgi:hypothetical protein
MNNLIKVVESFAAKDSELTMDVKPRQKWVI